MKPEIFHSPLGKFWCTYHNNEEDGEPYLSKSYDCAQHGPETSDYCEEAATWLGLKV